MEYKTPIIKTIIGILLAGLCIGLVAANRSPVGPKYLGLQLLGLAGLLVILFVYNRRYK